MSISRDMQNYTSKAKEFCELHNFTIEYLALGLNEEAGEVAGKVKRLLRGDYDSVPVNELESELGDVLWYFALFLDFLGIDIKSVMHKNLNKLNERKQQNTIKGTGDER